MGIITLTKAVDFPTGALRSLLSTHVPRFRWQCGDDVVRSEKEVVPFNLEQLILGVGSPDVIMVTARQIMQPATQIRASHHHRFHIELTSPTTDDAELALQITLLIAAGLVIDQDDGALVQLKPGGNWLSAGDLEAALKIITTGQPISAVERLGSIIPSGLGITPGAVEPDREQFSVDEDTMAYSMTPAVHGPDLVDRSNTAPLQRVISPRSKVPDIRHDRVLATPPHYADEGVFLDRLPTLVVLLEDALHLNWDLVREGLRHIDPEGEWSIHCDPNGHGIISGKSGGVKLDFVQTPVRGRLIPDALTRSYWFNGERERIDDHRCQLTLSASINTRATAYSEVEKTARIITLVVATICREPEAVAVYNAGAATINAAQDVAEMMNILADEELPIQLWVHVEWRSLEFEAVSSFTSGFAPFFGYEIEVWDAPVSAKFVQVKMSDVMRYLLRRGPVIQSGDAFGVREDDKNIRCRFSDSRVDRKRPVFAMNIDFARGSELSAPRPERLSERRGAPSLIVSPGPAKVASFGRKGL